MTTEAAAAGVPGDSTPAFGEALAPAPRAAWHAFAVAREPGATASDTLRRLTEACEAAAAAYRRERLAP